MGERAVFRRLAERETGGRRLPGCRTSGNPQRFLDDYGASSHAVQTLKNVGDLRGHQGCVNTVNFNPSGDLIVSGSDDMTVKVWNTHTQTCLTTLRGHSSNVFAANFFPHKSDREIISGGNDSDVRYFDLTTRTCRVYGHHSKKVLRLSVNPVVPDTFLSCSADGTVRLFDIRIRYENTQTRTFADGDTAALLEPEYVLPQAFGGGRASRISSSSSSANTQTLVLDYRADPAERRLVPATLFSVDFHPTDGHSFIVGSMDGNVRLFDLRRISNHSPSSCVNLYRNCSIPIPTHCEVTGCVFSRDGSEIVGTCLNEHVYVWDTARNFAKELGVDYFGWQERAAARGRVRATGSAAPRRRRASSGGRPADPARRTKKKRAGPSRSGSELEPAPQPVPSSSSSSSSAPSHRTAPVAVPRSPHHASLVSNPVASPPGLVSLSDTPVLSPPGNVSASRGSSRSGSPPSSPMYRRVGIRQHSSAAGGRQRQSSGTGSGPGPGDEEEEHGHGPLHAHGGPAASPGHHPPSAPPGPSPGHGPEAGRTFTVSMGDLEVDFLVQVISDPVRPHAHGHHDDSHPTGPAAGPRARASGSGRHPPPSLSSSPSAHGAPPLSSPPSSAPSPAHGPLGLWSPSSSPAPVSVAPPPSGPRPAAAPGPPSSAAPRSLLTALPGTPQPEPAAMSLPSSVATSPLIGPLPPPPPIEGIISSCSEADDVGEAVASRPVLYRTGAPPPPPFCTEHEAPRPPSPPSPLRHPHPAPAPSPPSGAHPALRSPPHHAAASPPGPQPSPSSSRGAQQALPRPPPGPPGGGGSLGAPPPRRRTREDEDDERDSTALSDGAGAGGSGGVSVGGPGGGEAHGELEEGSHEEEEEEEEDSEALDEDDEGDEREEGGPSEATYKQQYRGHYSMSTIKGVSFFGRGSEYVASGSDDARVFVWEKRSGRLVRVLEGHESVVNCVVGHPHDPVLLSSGIDNVVKVWAPSGEPPSRQEAAAEERRIQDVAARNQRHYRSDPNADAVGSLCGQQ